MSDKVETIITVAVIVALVIFFVICIAYIVSNHHNQAQIIDGFIVDKEYYPATGGKYGHGAQYTVTVENNDGIQANYDVTPLLYDRLNIGDYIENVNQALK